MDFISPSKCWFENVLKWQKHQQIKKNKIHCFEVYLDWDQGGWSDKCVCDV